MLIYKPLGGLSGKKIMNYSETLREGFKQFVNESHPKYSRYTVHCKFEHFPHQSRFERDDLVRKCNHYSQSHVYIMMQGPGENFSFRHIETLYQT